MLRLALALALLTYGCEEEAPAPAAPAPAAPAPAEPMDDEPTEPEPADEIIAPSYSEAELDAMDTPALEAACFEGATAACDRLGH